MIKKDDDIRMHSGMTKDMDGRVQMKTTYSEALTMSPILYPG
jgi:hypothetical protein